MRDDLFEQIDKEKEDLPKMKNKIFINKLLF